MAPEKITPQFLHDLAAKQFIAWEELYDRYSPCLYGLIQQNVSAEISASVLEETFLTMYDHIHEYRADKELFFTWMYKLTLRSCVLAEKTGRGLNASGVGAAAFWPNPILSGD